MIYESFSMRLHPVDDAEIASAKWTLKAGDGALEHFIIGDVSNPMARPKTAYEDIPGLNGAFDATEQTGRVLYNRKTVVVTLQGEAAFKWMDETEDAFRPYDGRVCDFAFAEPNEVNWFHTGRLTVDSNRFRNRITLTFDTEPLMAKKSPVQINVPVVDRLDRTSFGWTIEQVLHGNAQGTTASGAENIVIGASRVGTVIQFVRTVNAGEMYTLGIVSKQGGEVVFWNSGNPNKTLGIADSQGKLRIRVTVDGSFYEWMAVGSTTQFLPSCRIEYRLAKLPVDGGELLNTVHHEFPSNVLLRPSLASHNESTHVILDGMVFDLQSDDDSILFTPDAILPGVRADLAGKTVDSIFVAVPAVGAEGDDESWVTMTFHEKAVG